MHKISESLFGFEEVPVNKQRVKEISDNILRRYKEMKHPRMEAFGAHVVVEVLPKDEKTEGGIIIPELHQDAHKRARVVAVGQGYRGPDGKFTSLVVKVGDVVVWNKHGGTPINYKGRDLIILQEHEIWWREA